MKSTLSAAEARRIALAAQGFARPRPTEPGTRQLNAALSRMATLQIDSVNVFARSHYMPLFSRVGPYDTAALDRLLFASRPPYVEYWAHVAAFIPSRTGRCSGSGWTISAPSTARRPTAGSRATARSSTGCEPS